MMKRTILVLLALLLLCVLMLPFIVTHSQEIKIILVGWFAFIRRNFSQATIEPAAIVTGIVILVLLIAAIEVFARSLTKSQSRCWRFRWTLSIVAAPFLMFAVGYATIGLGAGSLDDQFTGAGWRGPV